MTCTESHKGVPLVLDVLKYSNSEPLMSWFIQLVLISITSSKIIGRYQLLCCFLALQAVVLRVKSLLAFVLDIF